MPRRSRRRRIHEEQERRWVDPLIEKLEERKLGPPPYAKRLWVWDDDIPHYGLMPFLGIAVSSITRTASLPPTSLSAWTSSSVSTGAASQAPAAMKWCN